MAAAEATLVEFVAAVDYEGKDATWDEWVVTSLRLNDIMVCVLKLPMSVQEALRVGRRCFLTSTTS